MNNPPAFPRSQFNPQGVGYEDAGIGCEAQDGMTLRDYFAAKAINKLTFFGDDSAQLAIAAHAAYQIADAMLKAREEQTP